jgi:hypothetical protein
MFNMLAEQNDKEDANTAKDATTATQNAAFATGSTLGNTYSGSTTIPLEITTAINQLAANQVAIQQQMAAMTFTAPPPSPTTQFHIPPVQNLGQLPFAGAAQGIFNPGQGGGGCQQGGRGRGCTGSPGGRRGRGVFANRTPGGSGGIPPFVGAPPRSGCAPNRSKGECPFPMKPDQKARKLERMLVVWV